MGQPLKLVTLVNGREVIGAEAERVRIEASYGLKAARIVEEMTRAARIIEFPERQSVSRGMAAVEARLVHAFWVLGRSTRNPGPRNSGRHGISYLFERADQDARYKDAAAQNWESVRPMDPVPSGREIDAADMALDWLQLIGRIEAEIVSAGARSKGGDVERRVNWARVRLQMPAYHDWTSDRLRKTYFSGLRNIAASVAA